MKKSWFKETRFIFLAFILALLIWGTVNVILGVYPFGDQTVMRVDLYHQYGPFHEELRHRLLNGRSLLYSWEGGMGKQFVAQFAYYTASPLSFLILLFPQVNMADAMSVFILLKIAFAAAFMAVYIKNTFKRNDFSTVAFALMYSFMAFITSYYWNIMWLDAVAMFPLVALGIDSLVKEDKHILYCLSLALIIITNFYIAFLVCVFASIYFLVILFSNCSIGKDKDYIVKRIIKFAIISLIAGGISMFLTVPAAIALSHTAASDSTFPAMEVYQNIWQLLTNHFIGSKPVILARNEDLPNVYSGLLAIMLLPMYFLNKNILKKEKVLFGIFIGIMLACSCIKPLDYTIHGFHFPSNLPHRFTFMYSFAVIVMAYKAFVNFKYVEFSHLFKIYGIYVLVILFTEFVVDPINTEVERVLTNGEIIANIMVMLVYIYLLNMYKTSKESERNVTLFVILVAVVIETCFSAYNGYSHLGPTNRNEYIKYYEYTTPNDTEEIDTAVEYINSLDDENDFYRTEFRRFTTINDACVYHFKGYSQFSSMAAGGISKLMENLGMAATSNSYRYYDPTPLLDSIFNIKYIMNKENMIANSKYEQIAMFPENGSVKPGSVSKPIYVYKNNTALPLGFMVNSDIKNWEVADSQPFDVQNDFVVKSGAGTNVLSNLDITDFEVFNIKTNNDDDAFDDNTYKYILTDKSDLGKIPEVKAQIYVPSDERVFLYVDAANAKRVKFEVKDDAGNVIKGLEDRELSAGRSLFDAGEVPAGTTVHVNFTLDNRGEHEKTYRETGTVRIYAATFEDEKFVDVYNNLSQQPYNIESYGDDFIKGEITAENDGVMWTSIPYDEGWKVTVDGEKVDLVSIGDDGFIGIDIPKGSHRVEFKYKPQGLLVGIILTLVSIVAFVLYTIFTRDKKLPLPEPEPIVIKNSKRGKRGKKRRKY